MFVDGLQRLAVGQWNAANLHGQEANAVHPQLLPFTSQQLFSPGTNMWTSATAGKFE